ncbi:helix-turn-helix domain-containing protein [Pseudaminobacter soli (ex Li et al. 2025)]|uniref:Transcriptional regulator n=1 Tax=Pseudaminobacter soli (ex Li et al. 2025) TaxID=1295366 RepID=A0A2P7RM83_9HYPH|nr:XRE family transcriptional regulator [Mesorhizobium soli]PSJ51334.1 transcriptional regulator [Mesorhizobium soli]
MNAEAVTSQVAGREENSLGQRLRERRTGLGLTLKEVADKAGFSVGFISQIERGITTPSLTSLVAVCRVLDADVSQFLSQPRGEGPVTRHEQRPAYAIGDSANAITYERLSAAFPGSALTSVLMHHPASYRTELTTHEGEEIFFVLQGALTVEVDGEATVLEAGDSIHFASTRPHASWNHASEAATILHTCTMDVFNNSGSDTAAPVAVSRAGRGNIATHPNLKLHQS